MIVAFILIRDVLLSIALAWIGVHYEPAPRMQGDGCGPQREACDQGAQH